MEFNVTYWEHNKFSTPASEEDVRAALAGYIEDAADNHLPDSDPDVQRARTALAELDAGTVPKDIGIIEAALRDNAFNAPEGTPPSGYDDNTDYVVTVKQ